MIPMMKQAHMLLNRVRLWWAPMVTMYLTSWKIHVTKMVRCLSRPVRGTIASTCSPMMRIAWILTLVRVTILSALGATDYPRLTQVQVMTRLSSSTALQPFMAVKGATL